MASSARIEELRKKFEENPRRYFAPLANEYRKAGDIEQAIAICREYLPQQPGHMSGHIVYGQALYEARQFEEAKTVFETALSLDPENLIALRHLGDIALIVGDSEVARSWYRRVLEADPRNEEIQSQLAVLDQSVSTSPTPVNPLVGNGAQSTEASSAPTVVVSAHSDLTPLSTPAISASSPAFPDLGLAPTSDVVLESLSTSPTAEVHLDSNAWSGEATAAPGQSQPSTPPAFDLESPVAGANEQEAGLFSGFSLEGLESTSFSAPSAAQESPVEAEPPSPPLPFVDLEPTAAPPASGPVSVPPAPAPAIPTFEFSGVVAPAPAAAADSGPFVTETMAELYLKQGHREEALRVYKALLEQRPDDAALRAKVSELEPPPGPTIREVLNVLALRRPGSRVNGQPTNGNTAPSISDLALLASSDGQPTAPMSPVELPTAPMPPMETAPHSEPAAGAHLFGRAAGTLSELFGSAPVSERDESAASALALTFAGTSSNLGAPADSLDATGAPARPATNELSLDVVFGAGKDSVAAPASFSFDQFFSRRATTPPASGVQAPPEASANASDDIADFTQWLEGLKQK